MPRYYFDIFDGGTLAVDEEGVEMPNIAAVQVEAARSLADIARDAADGMRADERREMAIEVRDDTGPVLQVRFLFEIARLKQ